MTQDLPGQLAHAADIDLIKDSSLRWRVVKNSVRKAVRSRRVASKAMGNVVTPKIETSVGVRGASHNSPFVLQLETIVIGPVDRNRFRFNYFEAKILCLNVYLIYRRSSPTHKDELAAEIQMYLQCEEQNRIVWQALERDQMRQC